MLQVLCFTRILDDVVQVPLAITHRCQVAEQFKVTLEQGLVARQLIAQYFVGSSHSDGIACNDGHEAVTTQGIDGLPFVDRTGMLHAGQVKQSGHDVIHMREAGMHPITGRLGNVGDARNN